MNRNRDGSAPGKDAYERALRRLVRREHSREELRQWLSQRGYEADVTEQALDRLIEDGAQSDTRFVEMLVRSRMRRGYGPLRIRAELGGHRVGREIIARALDEQGEGWEACAETQLTKQYGAQLDDDFEQRSKYSRYLLRRGFDAATVNKVVRALMPG